MIRVIVELCPGGDESRARQIASMKVWREHPKTSATSRYGFRRVSKRSTVWGTGVEHQRQNDVWALIRAALNHDEQNPRTLSR